MTTKERPIKALGEIALRVRDLEIMQEFYEKVIGLEILQRFENIVFFKIATGYGGHIQLFGLFNESEPSGHRLRTFSGVDTQTSPLHHFAFTIGQADFETEKERLEQLGLVVETQDHAWIHFRSLYVLDPEGNLVELVCHDASVQ